MSLIWMGLKGPSLSEEEKTNIQKYAVSGLILFKRNVKSLPQLWELCREIKSLTPPPLIMMDREGGAVDRLCHLPDFPPWPGPAKLSQLCSLEDLEKTAHLMASEMKALGLCLNFAPVVDVPPASASAPAPTSTPAPASASASAPAPASASAPAPASASAPAPASASASASAPAPPPAPTPVPHKSRQSPLLAKRFWGNTAKTVSERALTWIKGFSQVGLASCVKHFPGHGGVSEDSHFQLPVDKRDLNTLKKHDLISFQQAINHGVEVVMTAHVAYPNVEKEFGETESKETGLAKAPTPTPTPTPTSASASASASAPTPTPTPLPATLSPFLLKKLLRGSMGFKGLLVSDDMDMKALSHTGLSELDIMKKAFSAGVDILLKCEPPKDLPAFLEKAKTAFKAQTKESRKIKTERLQQFQQKYADIQPAHSLQYIQQALSLSHQWHNKIY